MRFFTPEWAETVRAAVDAGPPREDKLPEYWSWIDRARTAYTATWALGVRETGLYLVLAWKDGKCVDAAISGDPGSADYVLTAGFATWRELREGADPGQAVMYRRLRLERGNVLAFFRVIYFFVESLAALSRVPAEP
ncbi:SCP2 sterol-binding domain-containing protein [Nonomuraea jiangxiensis]|uniref:SCP-2 sterol transfer family protein n=1 Tax=Nonomuraea jiangxiensis TaxID=633440 RepID=A0A1G9FUP1_9ACTN|nr:SCP2 sterol-binding domain-containing protein [Nonomuraea jiangxiensis]SDK92119.1 SCP-2 sterol transfer family protein [Nonomuraea jiangxiensis]